MNKKSYIKHGPKGLKKIVDNVDEFVDFIRAFCDVSNEPELWEFEIIKMTEEEFEKLPEFEGF